MRTFKHSNGFTLVEMLIVIAIISILYSIALVNVSGMQSEARISRAQGDLKTLKLALDGYLKNHGYCPEKNNYQADLLQQKYKVLEGNLMDQFARAINTLYSYDVSDNKYYYVVYSIGEDMNGTASVNNKGIVTYEGSVIFTTNGYF